MSGFMEDVEDDLKNVFFDPDTFGSIHEVDGKEVTVVYDSIKRSLVPKGKNELRDDVHDNVILLSIPKKDIGRRLKINSCLDLDGEKMFVHSVTDEEGVYNITLGRKMI